MALRSIRVAPACSVDAFEPRLDVTLPYTFPSGDALYNVIEGALVDVAASLEHACHDRGWLDARPIRPFVHRTGNEVDARVHMFVGSRYRVDHVQVVDVEARGDRTLQNQVLPTLEVKSGADFDRLAVMRDMKRLRDLGEHRRVELVLDIHKDTTKVDVTFRLQRLSSDS